MAIIFSTAKWQLSIVYLDDIVIFFRTPYQHIIHTLLAINFRKEAHFTFKLKNCVLFSIKTDYLVNVIRPSRLELADDLTDTIRNLKVPTTKIELRSFNGFLTFSVDVSQFRLHHITADSESAKDADKRAGKIK